VAIGLSPPLAYCSIFSVIFSDVVICIFAYVCTAGTPQLHLHRPPTPRHLPCWPVYLFTTWPEATWQFAVLKTIAWTLLFHIRLCWVKIDSAVSLGQIPNLEFVQCVLWGIVWRLVVSGSESPSNTTGKVMVLVRWVILLFFATLWHCRELSDKRFADPTQFKYWLLWQLTPGITDCSLPILRCQQSIFVAVVYADATCICCSAPAACR